MSDKKKPLLLAFWQGNISKRLMQRLEKKRRDTRLPKREAIIEMAEDWLSKGERPFIPSNEDA